MKEAENMMPSEAEMLATGLLEKVDPDGKIREKNIEREISENLDNMQRNLDALEYSGLCPNDIGLLKLLIVQGITVQAQLNCRKTAVVISRCISELFEEMPWIRQAVKGLEYDQQAGKGERDPDEEHDLRGLV